MKNSGCELVRWLVLLVLLTLSSATPAGQSAAAAAKGPLRVHPDNPRYFTDGSGKVVYLTGFQYWDIVREDGSPGPDAMEFTRFLDIAKQYGTSFVRLWRWNELAIYEITNESHPDHPVQGKRVGTGEIEVPGGSRHFKPPFAGDAVLYLKALNDLPRRSPVAAGAALHLRKETGLSRQVELYHWVDFSMEAPGAADGLAKWDVEGSCRWTHESGAQRTSLLWYSGSGDTYVYRFGGSSQGRWTGTTRSPVAALDGLTLTVDVTPSGNPNRIGWSGQMAGEPTAWAHQKGLDGRLVKRTPILVMMPDVQRWHGDLDAMRTFVAEFNENHGFNGGHISTVGRGWFEAGSRGALRDAPSAPDTRTFAALETAASKWSERGGWLHIWMWGKGSGGDFSLLPGGYDGAQSRRINRYIAARLGPVPGWSMGIGWDVEFWVNEPIRAAMGHTRRLAERVNLAAMQPRNELATTGYCLANPGNEYLVYQPAKGGPFSVELAKGVYQFEWFDPVKGAVAGKGRIEAPGGPQQFKAPFASDAVLYLKMAAN